MLALLDTFPGKPMSSAELLIKLLRMPWREKISYSFSRMQRSARYLQRRLTKQLPADLLAVRKACHLAESSYLPGVYPGRVIVFRPSTKSLRSIDDATAGWSGWAAGGVEIHEIAGSHHDMFFQPNVSILAKKLNASLMQAEMQVKTEQLTA